MSKSLSAHEWRIWSVALLLMNLSLTAFSWHFTVFQRIDLQRNILTKNLTPIEIDIRRLSPYYIDCSMYLVLALPI